ncbi:MAG TPA: RhuM family protein [Cerasibacillus sp.]|uniref:virulence RhuM family protein n=1 Tax=Cerasibacillus sp. TaxID=2498711 RepID=UPI002F3EA618
MENQSNFLMYQTEDGETKISVRLEDGTVWLTQKTMAELFQTSPQNIALHVKNIYEDGELKKVSTCKKYLQVQIEGSREVKRKAKHYNLEMILAVGYRVRLNEYYERLGSEVRCFSRI